MEIQIAVPNKGRLREPTLRALDKAGIVLMDKNDRMLYARTADPEVRVIFIRASDIPRFVEEGAADLGITGLDFIKESGADVEELLDLKFGRARVVVASSGRSKVSDISDVKSGMRVATKFSNLARKYFEGKKKSVSVVKISGAAEIMPYLGVADLVVDVTSTGTTLGTHGLRIIGDILETSARLIANKQSLEEKKAKIREIVLAFESVMRAERKKLVMMNVPEKALPAVKRVLPAMAGPTLAKVESAEPMWEVYSVIDEKDVYRVINGVKKAGARDIIVVPIERIIP